MNIYINIFNYLRNVFLLSCSVTFIYIFFNAYTHNFITIVDINYYKEAHIEAFFITLLTIISIISIYFEVKNVNDN
jgi:hypothetical protein